MVIKLTSIKELGDYLDKKYPATLAWDEDLPRIGFIIGDKFSKINNVLLTLDINEEVIEEAIRLNVNLIISHHPFIFNPIYKIDYNSTLGKQIYKLIQNKISVYVMHTNYDVGYNGVNDNLAKLLVLNNIVGSNELNSYLRYGEVSEMKFKEYLKYIKEKLQLDGLKYAGNLSKSIKSIGIVGGSGGNLDFIEAMLINKIDLYISSEFKLNVVQYAVSNNLCIIEVNHGVEKLALNTLKEKLQDLLETNVYVSSIDTDPFKYYI